MLNHVSKKSQEIDSWVHVNMASLWHKCKNPGHQDRKLLNALKNGRSLQFSRTFQKPTPSTRSLNRCQHFIVTSRMMTSSNKNISRVTGHLCGEFTGPGEFPTQRPVTRSLMFPLICVWINGWENNREAGDLRRYRAHYDVIVMEIVFFHLCGIHIWRVIKN